MKIFKVIYQFKTYAIQKISIEIVFFNYLKKN